MPPLSTPTASPPGGAARLRLLTADLLREGQAVRLEVTGHSMAPFLRPEDLVTIVPRRDGSHSVGEVLAVRTREGRLLVHRLVARGEAGLLLRGDASPAADPRVAQEDVLGVVTRVERRGRRVRVGLGPERRAVAWLSRTGLLRRLGRLQARQRASASSPA